MGAALLATALTGPAVAASPPAESAAQASAGDRDRTWARAMTRRMNVDQKIGQMITGYVYGPTADTPDPRNEALYGVSTPAEVVREHHLGGVIYFAWTDSFENPEQVATLSNGLQQAAMTTGARVPLAISTDQEHGVVTRLGEPATPLPGSMALGAGRSADDAREAARIAGSDLAAVGINQNYAPVADVNVDPLNPVIGVRSFSSDPDLVAELTAAQVQGLEQDAGVMSTAKHFPGHGDTAVDSHVGLPVIDHTREEWESIDLPPFEAAIDAGIDSIMTAHLVMPALDDSGVPATLSEPIITGELRENLGYDGVITTDSLEMEGVRTQFTDGEIAVRAVEAGVDVLLMPAQPIEAVEALHEALDSGRLTEERLDESVERILLMKARQGVTDGPMVDAAATATTVGTAADRESAQALTDRTVTALENDGTLPVTDPDASVLVTGWGASTTANLGAALEQRGHPTTVLETGAQPSADAVDDAVAEAADADVVVVLTQKAWDTGVTDPDARQQALVAALLATGTDVVHVAVRDPYDIAYLPGVRTSLATYSYTSVSMESLARVITGEASPHGVLPVDVPTEEDPDTVLYPFGTGMDW